MKKDKNNKHNKSNKNIKLNITKKENETKKNEKKDEKNDDPMKNEHIKDETKKDETKKDETKKDETKKDETKKDETKKDEKKDETKKDEKKDETKKNKRKLEIDINNQDLDENKKNKKLYHSIIFFMQPINKDNDDIDRKNNETFNNLDNKESDDDTCNDDTCNDDTCNDDTCNDDTCNDDMCDDDTCNDKNDIFNDILNGFYNDPYNDPYNNPYNDYDKDNDPYNDYDKENDPDYNPKSDPDNNSKSDPDNDSKSDNDSDSENKENDDFDKYYNQPNKLENIFNKIIGNINKKLPPVKKSKKEKEIDEFRDYFKDPKNLIPINKPVKTLNDLIELGESYDPLDKNKYVINLKALNKCVNHLKDLNNMIGMKNIKEMIIDLIFFRLQNIDDSNNELWHLVIQGTPGSGKTEVAKIIGKLYHTLGIVKKDMFTQVKRSDLIGKYLGHTAKMTQEVFDKAKGGVLFIDEAYSLGNPENRDSFSKECIDTINQNLTENRETVVFIAGYKEQLDESFFSYNPGLNRRFKMRLSVDKYNASDLRQIYIKKVKENNWEPLNSDYEKNIPLSFFEKNVDTFKYNGGDMENLWHLTKIAHARRIFGMSNELVKKITFDDIQSAYNVYCLNDEVKNRNESLNKYVMNSMYC